MSSQYSKKHKWHNSWRAKRHKRPGRIRPRYVVMLARLIGKEKVLDSAKNGCKLYAKLKNSKTGEYAQHMRKMGMSFS